MSLLVFIFYWVIVPVLLFLVARKLYRNVATSLQKRTVVAGGVVVFLGLLWLAAGEKWWLDYQVRELCAKDGGIRVYETVRLPPELIDKYGVIRIHDKAQAKPTDEYYYESSMQYIKRGDPEMWQLRFRIFQRPNDKLVGESINYARVGGDPPGPWHKSAFGCPANADISDLKKQVFVK